MTGGPWRRPSRWREWRGEDEAIAAWAAERAALLDDRLRSGREGRFAGRDAVIEANLALQNWTHRQQALIQQQWAIDSKVRTWLTRCQYAGVILRCTTS